MRIMRVAPAAIGLLTELESGCDLHPTAHQHTLLRTLEGAGMIHPMPSHTSLRPIPVITPVFRVDPTAQAPQPFTVPEAIVVDDGSTPGIPQAQIRLESNAGPAVARNTGFEYVMSRAAENEPEYQPEHEPEHQPEHQYVIFLDADVDPGPDPHWYLPLLALCERDPQLAVVAPRVCSLPGPSRRDRYESTHSPLDLGDQPGRVQPGTRISYLPSTALLCRVSALREVGGFTTALRFGEDVDLIWRLIAAGWSCRYHPDVVVHHPPRSSWAAWGRQRIGYGSSAVSLGMLHGPKVAPAHFHPFSWATWTLVLSGHPLLAAATTAGSLVALDRKVPGLPRNVSTRIVLRGTWLSGLGLARVLRRVWWPLVIPAALVSRRARALLLLSCVVAGPPRSETAISIIDDLAYSLGVWKGIWTKKPSESWRAHLWGALWALLPTTSPTRRDATVRT